MTKTGRENYLKRLSDLLIDLHRYCRYVIHHDLDWNPSDIEQRTGRIDRLGCKAEGKHPIAVFLPYISGTADERQ